MIETVFTKLVDMSVNALWFLLAVFVIRLVFSKAPKWVNDILWGIAAFSLVCPVTIESVFSLVPNVSSVSSGQAGSSIGQLFSPPNAAQSLSSAVSEPYVPPVSQSVSSHGPMFYISVLWLCGTLIMLIYAFLSYAQVHKRLKEAVRHENNIYICDRISSPFIFGFLKPKIYLTSNISESDAKYVVMHELAHIKRLDNIRKPLGFLLLSIYWFNPVVWLAFILFCRDIELACDEAVIKKLSASEKKNYSYALVNCSAKEKFVTACPVAFGETGVKMRIKSILNYKKPAFWVIIAALAACVTAAVCLLTNPKSENYLPSGQFKLGRTIYTNLGAGRTDGTKIEINESGVYVWEGEKLMQGSALKKVRLSEENFADLFKSDSEKDIDAEKIKSENEQAWVVDAENLSGNLFYMTLRQKDGSVYCAYADFDGEKPDKITSVYEMEFTAPDNVVLSTPDTSVSLDAQVLEVLENSLLVKPAEGNEEVISVSLNGVKVPEAKTGSKVTIYFDGRIAETYPAQILKPYSISVLDGQGDWVSYEISGDWYKIYSCKDESLDFEPQMMLSQNGDTFSFAWSADSGQLAHGKYEIDSGKLILTDENGLDVYVFDVSGDNFTFSKGDSKLNTLPGEYRIPSGAVFSQTGSSNAKMPDKSDLIVSKLIYDIDRDGNDEILTVAANPAVSAERFTISASFNGEVKYSRCYVCSYCVRDFETGQDGKAKLRLTKLESGGEEIYDISLENGEIILSRNGKEL